MRGAAFTSVMILAAAFAGCVAPVEPAAPAASADADENPWERGLATSAATPDTAARRSAAERESAVVPPGAPQFAAFDAVVAAFLASHDIPAATVAVLRDGKLRYEQGYGHLDEARTKPTPPDAMMRIASVTKPMTAAVVLHLVEAGVLGWDDPVFCLPPAPAAGCLLAIEPHPARPVADARVADLTLRHLVEHRTGWTRGPCTTPTQWPLRVADDLGIASPPPAWRLAQWMLGEPMEFDPGTNPNEGRGPGEPRLDPYCNAGYGLLGLAAEARTGASLAALYEAHLFAPLELVGEIEPGHTLPGFRNPREPFYACDEGMTPSIYDRAKEVCWADGGFDLDAALALGGLVATAAAVGAVYEAYANDGSLRTPSGNLHRNGHSGSLPGTEALAWRFHVGGGGRDSDVTFVILFNKGTGRAEFPEEANLVDPFQDTYADLFAAYVAAESGAPAAARAAAALRAP